MCSVGAADTLKGVVPKEIIEEKQQIIRQSSEKLIQRLEPIQERTPLYSDLRKERIEKHNMKMSSIFSRAFNY